MKRWSAVIKPWQDGLEAAVVIAFVLGFAALVAWIPGLFLMYFLGIDDGRAGVGELLSVVVFGPYAIAKMLPALRGYFRDDPRL